MAIRLPIFIYKKFPFIAAMREEYIGRRLNTAAYNQQKLFLGCKKAK